jgi:hypothetical protein
MAEESVEEAELKTTKGLQPKLLQRTVAVEAISEAPSTKAISPAFGLSNRPLPEPIWTHDIDTPEDSWLDSRWEKIEDSPRFDDLMLLGEMRRVSSAHDNERWGSRAHQHLVSGGEGRRKPKLSIGSVVSSATTASGVSDTESCTSSGGNDHDTWELEILDHSKLILIHVVLPRKLSVSVLHGLELTEDNSVLDGYQRGLVAVWNRTHPDLAVEEDAKVTSASRIPAVWIQEAHCCAGELHLQALPFG